MVLDIMFWGFVIIVLAVLLFLSIRIVRPTHRGVVERFGKFNRIVSAGIHFLIPFVDRMIYINITEQMVDAESQEVITKDNLNAKVDAQIYFKVQQDDESVKKSQYHVDNYKYQIVNLARTTLRDIIGNMTLTEANNQRNRLNTTLAKELREQTNIWGIQIVRSELKEIEPPEDVQATMNDVVKAENERIAAKDRATAVEIVADGERRAEIKKAEGQARAVELKAEADAKAIKLVNEAAEKYFKGNAVTLKRLEVAENSLRDNAKLVVPSGSEVINMIGLDGGKPKIIPLEKKPKK